MKSGLAELFENQITALLLKKYPKAAGISDEKFLDLIKPLKKTVENLPVSHIDLVAGHIPLVLVVKSTLVPTEQAMSRVEKNGKNGITKLFPSKPEDFVAINSVQIPDSPIYLIVNVDRGTSSLNMRPVDALKIIQNEQRSPLTIDEGIAIVTQYPEFLIKNHCFSLLASRNSHDKRVPAIWINGQKHPNLGWCWEGNPHTWLGSASCTQRLV